VTVPWGTRRCEPLSAPGAGRRFRAERRLRLADVLPSGASRLDALARYLQDVAGDDMNDAGFGDEVAWVVRRTRLEVVARPAWGGPIELSTWCSATGPCWAERRTTIRTGDRDVADAASLWVALDPSTQRPVKLTDAFVACFVEASAGRRISSRLYQADPPSELPRSGRRWPLRLADVDFLGHVNNAVSWAAVEDELTYLDGASRDLTAVGGPIWAEIEYRAPIQLEEEVEILSRIEDEGVKIWLLVEGSVRTSAVVRAARHADG
jgi:acyl-ACP thioesterase